MTVATVRLMMGDLALAGRLGREIFPTLTHIPLVVLEAPEREASVARRASQAVLADTDIIKGTFGRDCVYAESTHLVVYLATRERADQLLASVPGVSLTCRSGPNACVASVSSGPCGAH